MRLAVLFVEVHEGHSQPIEGTAVVAHRGGLLGFGVLEIALVETAEFRCA